MPPSAAGETPSCCAAGVLRSWRRAPQAAEAQPIAATSSKGATLLGAPSTPAGSLRKHLGVSLEASLQASLEASPNAPLDSPPSSPGASSSHVSRVPTEKSNALRSPRTPHLWEDHVSAEVLQTCRNISPDRLATVSAHDLIAAVRRDRALAALVLPMTALGGILASEERTADAVDAIFEDVAEGRRRIRMSELASYLESQRYLRIYEQRQPGSCTEARDVFALIDVSRKGSISKLELFEAVRKNPKVANYLLPEACTQEEEHLFDEVKQLFSGIAGGKKRIELSDFEHHFQRSALEPAPPSSAVDRSRARVMVLEAGFARGANARRSCVVEEAGYQLRWSACVPELPRSGAPAVSPEHLEKLRADIADFQPDVVVAASSSGAYVTALWSAGLWTGPTVLIDAHLSCRRLPLGVPVVLAYGSCDEVYRLPRTQLEELIATSTRNECFLYHTPVGAARMGLSQPGRGDASGMESLCRRDCLPRLIDAALSPDGPELSMMRSWRARLSDARQEAERWLGYSPERLRRRWCSPGGKGLDDCKLFEVAPASEEFRQVEAVFLASPVEAPVNDQGPHEAWDEVRVVAVHRVENGVTLERSIKPYYHSLGKSVEDQGIPFEPGTHTCWAFHGADAGTLDSIINDPIAAFKPLAASPGAGDAAEWGSGAYFARDARRLAAAGLCGAPSENGGTRSMLMCLLSSGLPCLGDPQHRGVLPMRSSPHRHHCAVDSLSSPETYVLQHPGAAHAAYLVTFA